MSHSFIDISNVNVEANYALSKGCMRVLIRLSERYRSVASCNRAIPFHSWDIINQVKEIIGDTTKLQVGYLNVALVKLLTIH